jgi:hypothetical protein
MCVRFTTAESKLVDVGHGGEVCVHKRKEIQGKKHQVSNGLNGQKIAMPSSLFSLKFTMSEMQ